ncbi:unnamed protein product [Closterium sp. NIES-54]
MGHGFSSMQHHDPCTMLYVMRHAPMHLPPLPHPSPSHHQMYYMDGMTDEQVCSLKQQHLQQPGDWALLTGASGATHAALVRGGPGSHDPVFVSVGHRVSLLSAVAITQRCCKHRVPEPVRLADGLSRAELRGVTVAEATGDEQSGVVGEQGSTRES